MLQEVLGVTAGRQFGVLALLIVLGGAAAFFHLASAAREDSHRRYRTKVIPWPEAQLKMYRLAVAPALE